MSYRVGIIGGGQLGMMLAEALKKYNAYVIALDPNPECSCSYVCDEMIVGAYNDLEALKKLGAAVDVITYEFENVPAEQLTYLAEHYSLLQGVKPLFDSQNRIREKKNALAHGLPVAEFYEINSFVDLNQALLKLGYPAIYKTTSLGYDGHGQVMLYSDEDVELVRPYLKGQGILEKFIEFDHETSIIMVRDQNKCIHYPLSYNIHKNGILDLSIAGLVEDKIAAKIREVSQGFMESCQYYGILTIEYFVKGEEIFFNEMAPRPHNSGHYTIEGCNSSQYDGLARFLLGLDLIEPSLLSPTVMKNILGKDIEHEALCLAGHHHLYHKKEIKPNRKMGHITFTNTTYEEYVAAYKKYFT